LRSSQILTAIAVQALGEGLHRIKLAWPAAPGSRCFEAGQFAELALPGLVLPRPFSILAADDEGMEFLVQELGPGTRRLASLRPGQRLRCTWPLGRGFASAIGADWPRGRDWLLLAGGVGIAPILAAARELAAARGSWTALPTGDGDRPRSEFFAGWRSAELARAAAPLHPDLGLHLACDDGRLGYHGFVTQALEAWLDGGGATHWQRPALLACGPEPMLAAVARLARARGLEGWLSLETYMGCGVGICVGCAVAVHGESPWRLACQHGPVFPLAELKELA
jgi:dihydroorotate dehydrogenase electron transfer subunit